MKKFFVITAMALLLTACGNTSEKETASKPKEEPKQAQQKTVENPQPQKDKDGNTVLTQVGQTIKADNIGTLELIKIKEVNQILNIAPIKVTINDLKIFKVTNINDDFKKFVETMYNKTGITEPVYYLQLTYSAENTSDKNIAWNGIHAVVTDKGEQLDPNLNLLSSNFNNEFFGKVTKSDQFGLLLSSDKWDISKVKLIFNESSDDTTYDTITPEQQVEYSF